MSRLFLFIVLFLSSRSLFGQVNFEWADAVGGNGSETAWSVATDAAGNVFTTGIFMGTADMNPGPALLNMTSLGPSDIFITKYGPAGNLVWVKQIGNTNPLNEGVRDIAVDATGNVYITGLFYGSVDFDPGPGAFNLTVAGTGYAAFLLKLDNNGNFVWAKNMGASSQSSSGYSVATTASGNIYVTGFFSGTADLDPGPGVFHVTAANPAQDIFITKLDNNGNFLWGKAFYSSSGQFAFSVCTDAQENVYTTGRFNGTSDFDPGPAVYNLTAFSNADAFVSRLDANGNFAWAKQFAGLGEGIGFGVVTDNSNNLYITGEFPGPTDFDPGPGVFTLNDNGDIKSFIVKLTINGDFIWAKSFNGPTGSTNQARSIACDMIGDVYVTGSFIHPVDFDPGPADYTLTTGGDWANSFISKLKADGSFAFALKIANTTNVNLPFGIMVDAAKNIYVCGTFYGAPDFDPGPGTYTLTSINNDADAYVLKLSQCVQSTSETITVNACHSYTVNNQTYTASGIYTQHLPNTIGCDSTLTIQLTIGGSETTTTISACDSYNWEGQTYTTSGNYTVTYTGAGGCDSVRKLNLVIRNSVSSVVTVSICAGENYQGHTTAGTYTDTYTGANGCDSVRTLYLSVKPVSQEEFHVTVCEGNPYWGHTTTGIYRDTLTAANGCDSIRILYLLVNPVKRVSRNISICQGETYFAAGANQSATGEYMDTYTSATGCDSIITTFLAVNPLPVPALGADRDLCEGSALQLTPGLFASYEWQDHSTGPSFAVAGTGIYWVKVTDVNHCMAADTIELMNTVPVPGNFLKPVDSVCQYGTLSLSAMGLYSSYSWSTGSSQPTIQVAQPGNYILKVKDSNGCNGSDTMNVYSKICRTGVYIPTAFTPNGDQLNDIFRPLVYGNVISFELRVYNRWGQLIFTSNDPYRGWDGKVKGKDSDTGVFVWMCRYQLQGNDRISEKGTVTVIR